MEEPHQTSAEDIKRLVADIVKRMNSTIKAPALLWDGMQFSIKPGATDEEIMSIYAAHEFPDTWGRTDLKYTQFENVDDYLKSIESGKVDST